MKKIDFKDLIDSGQLKREPDAGKDQVARLLKRAGKDLEAATHVKEIDEAIAMQAAYDAMFHAANALLRQYGFRPGPVRQHRGVIAAVSRILGGDAQLAIEHFDDLRKRRNQFEYQGMYEMGSSELEDALDHAKSFVALIREAINQK